MDGLLSATTAETGGSGGFDQNLLALYYDELRRIARAAMRGAARITLQPTDLAHAAALRLLESRGLAIQDEAHLLALAARAIRTTFIDEVRRMKEIAEALGLLGCTAHRRWASARGGLPKELRAA